MYMTIKDNDFVEDIAAKNFLSLPLGFPLYLRVHKSNSVCNDFYAKTTLEHGIDFVREVIIYKVLG